MTVSRPTILARLREQGLRFTEISLEGGVTILVSELGGRVFGPFLTPEAESLFWVNPDWGSAAAFASLAKTGWNFGGERLWITPEIQYLVRDRTDYFNSLFFPPDMDPGHWTMAAQGSTSCRLWKDLTLEAFNLARGVKNLRLETEIAPQPNPLRHLACYTQLMEGVIYAGYRQSVNLTESENNGILSGVWNLVQLPPGGELIIPTAANVEPTVYKGLLDSEVQEVSANHIRLSITARQMYKAGYKAAQVFGRMAYHHLLLDSRAALLVRDFPNHPSSEYPEEPPDQPGRSGDSIYIYNDDGRFGEFGEMECSGATIGGLTGKSTTQDEFSLWLYVGPIEQVNQISLSLLGISLKNEREQRNKNREPRTENREQ